jgi:hypothetical protein
MNDLTPKTTQEVRRFGMVGVGAGISGLGLLILNGFSGGWGGLVVGALVALGGFGIMGSKGSSDPKDKRLGGLVTAAGVVTAGASLLSILHFLGPLAALGQFVLWGSGIGLLGLGIWNIIKFVKGLKSRA